MISLVFLSPLVGYTASALMNNTIHLKFGQRGVGVLASICHLIAYIVIAVHPPYPVLVVIFMIAGFGNGLADAAWNAWMGNMANPNEVLGFLHAFYGLGAVLSPLIATTMITKGHLQWYTFYYVMIGMAFLELCTSATAFWKADGAAFRAANPRTTDTKDSRLKEALFRLPNARVTWLCAMFLLGYVGIEVALGGWIVKFMLEVRKGGDFASGMTATGFWMGITVGRLVLGFITPRLGEKLAIAVRIPLPFLAMLQTLTIQHRSTYPSPWPSNSSSGLSRSSMSLPSRSPSRASSLAHCSLLLSSLQPNYSLDTCTSVRLDLRRHLVDRARLSFPSLLVRSRRRRVCRSCSRLFWRCWVSSWGCGFVCREFIRNRSRVEHSESSRSRCMDQGSAHQLEYVTINIDMEKARFHCNL